MSVLERKLFVGGEWVDGATTREVRSPWDGAVVGRVALAGPQAIERAIASAVDAAPTLAAAPAHRRAEWLGRIVEGLSARRQLLEDTIVAEGGKPRQFARGEVARGLTTFELARDESRRLGGEVVPIDAVPTGEGRLGIVRRFPAGPVAAITPFNFPLNLVAHKVAPALAAGCPVVLKPADETPLSSLILAEVVEEAGVPPGALNVVPCEVAHAAPLVEDPRIRVLTFTGSGRVGWSLKSRAGRKRVLLELGGNAAAVVHDDADLEHAVARCATGAFAHAGQVCISVQRIYVQRAVHDAFLEQLVAAAEALAVGDPSDPATVCGPLRSDADADRVTAWVEEAVAAGAVRHCGGERRGRVLTPMVLTGVSPEARLDCDEVFGPVVAVHPYGAFEDALRAVDASDFGLQAGVFTRDVGRIFRAFERLEVGGVIHDDVPTFRVDQMPYGGVKGSGLGREGLRYAIEDLTEPRILVLRPGSGAP